MKFLLLFFVLMSNVSYATKETGNGGEYILVNGEPRLFDLVEGDNAICTWKTGLELLQSMDMLQKSVVKMREINDEFADRLTIELINLRFCFTNNSIRKIEDTTSTYPIVVNKEGAGQLAIRVKDQVFVSNKIYSKLSEVDKQFLIIHEILHSFLSQEASMRKYKIHEMTKFIYLNSQKTQDSLVLGELMDRLGIYFPHLDEEGGYNDGQYRKAYIHFNMFNPELTNLATCKSVESFIYMMNYNKLSEADYDKVREDNTKSIRYLKIKKIDNIIDKQILSLIEKNNVEQYRKMMSTCGLGMLYVSHDPEITHSEMIIKTNNIEFYKVLFETQRLIESTKYKVLGLNPEDFKSMLKYHSWNIVDFYLEKTEADSRKLRIENLFNKDKLKRVIELLLIQLNSESLASVESEKVEKMLTVFGKELAVDISEDIDVLDSILIETEKSVSPFVKKMQSKLVSLFLPKNDQPLFFKVLNYSLDNSRTDLLSYFIEQSKEDLNFFENVEFYVGPYSYYSKPSTNPKDIFNKDSKFSKFLTIYRTSDSNKWTWSFLNKFSARNGDNVEEFKVLYESGKFDTKAKLCERKSSSFLSTTKCFSSRKIAEAVGNVKIAEYLKSIGQK